MRSGEITVRPQPLAQLDECATADQVVAQHLVLGVRSVAPVDVVRPAERGDLGHPAQKPAIGRHGVLVPHRAGAAEARRAVQAIETRVRRQLGDRAYELLRESLEELIVWARESSDVEP